jgi:REP element-mobilizing transposase RayT
MTADAMQRKPRLSRLDFIYQNAPVFFITFCTHNRRPLLANDSVHSAFVNFCQAALRQNIHVGRYVVMPDHLHFFVGLPDTIDLSTWIKSMKNSISKSLRELSIPAPHWQKAFFDHLLRTDESAASKWEYIRLNPARAGLVHDASQWPYQGEVAILY